MKNIIKKFIEEYFLLRILPIVTFLLIGCVVLYLFNYYNHNNLIFSFPANYSINKEINKENKKYLSPNEIGDSIGGIMSPIIGLTGVILTFLAFYIQYKANRQEQEQHRNERIQTLIFKAIENKDNLILYLNKGDDDKVLLKDKVIKLSNDIKDKIFNDLKLDFIHVPDKHKFFVQKNKRVKLLFEKIKKETDNQNQEEAINQILNNVIYREQIISYFLSIDSKQIIKENKIKGAYILIQSIIQENLNFIYSYIKQINFILQQINKLKESKEITEYFFGTLRNEEVCLLLYLYLYSIPKKRQLRPTVKIDNINIDVKFIQRLQQSNMSLDYSNDLLFGEITFNQLIQEINLIEKHCQEFPSYSE